MHCRKKAQLYEIAFLSHPFTQTPSTALSQAKATLEKWTLEKAHELYGVRHWGAGYFDISPEGTIEVRPNTTTTETPICLMDVVAGLKERGLEMPVLLRFGDILHTQIKSIYNSFEKAISSAGYKGIYRGVYPIKVNQQQQVIEELTSLSKPLGHGLEAGSKPELIAALTYFPENDGLLICNGYKDEEFIDLALFARKLDIRSVIVVETPREITQVIERSKALGIKPYVGVRVKLSAKAGGHWQESGGDQSVFGLNTAQIIDVVNELREADMLDCLQLLHYHLGSQLPSIQDIRNSLVEASRIYAGLVREGAPMGILDIGGGLAVDYDGSHTNFSSSRNYTMDEYCSDVIEVVMQIMDEEGLQHPTIVNEAGRATVAYHSVLLFNILDASQIDGDDAPPAIPKDAHDHVHNTRELLSTPVTAKNCQEIYHDAIHYRDDIRQLFRHGSVSLRERALVEEMFWHVMNNIARTIRNMKYVPDDFDGLQAALADIYYANFSVFQSLPDSWAIEQLFPIMPIHRLNEQPTRESVLSDITCDCDGKVDRFIDLKDVKRTLKLHALKADEEYYIGVFLVGAYQETLGDLHNLFGDTHVVSIRTSEDGELEFEREIEGDSVADVLSYVEYDPKAMLEHFKQKAERAVRRKSITPQERRKLVDVYQAGLQGYTYLER